ncbi:MAG TPA: hypothetical protein VGM90_40845 [Kofleriaceae bacterium]
MARVIYGVVKNGVIVVDKSHPLHGDYRVEELQEGLEVEVHIREPNDSLRDLTAEEQADYQASVAEIEAGAPTYPWRDVLADLERQR